MNRERPPVAEQITKLAGAGLIALALSACSGAPPSEARAYYDPFTDTITYIDGSDSDPQLVAHEEAHQNDAREYPYGRWVWGLRYSIDDEFACLSEARANEKAGYTDIYNHSKCDGVIE